MANPAMEKFSLWRDSTKGLTSRFRKELKPPVTKRDDISEVDVTKLLDKASIGRKIRLKHSPTIDIDREQLYAGTIPVTKEKLEGTLKQMGFRTNLGAYVEVLNGKPDDGAYSKNTVTELSRRVDVPQVYGTVGLFPRVKEQLAVTVFEGDGEVDIMAHKTVSPMAQPVRSTERSDGSAREGVREFRSLVSRRVDKEVPGKEDVSWDTNV